MAISISLPFTESQVRSLKVGDEVLLNGVICTGRDRMHKYFIQNDSPINLKGGVIYHCGPIVKISCHSEVNCRNDYKILAAGPTTSIRMEYSQADIIEKTGVRAVIGKGGMGKKTRDALKKFGAIYLQAIGGAAQLLASKIIKVREVHYLEEFGEAEAFWVLEVKDFPAIVAMDSHGSSLYDSVAAHSEQILNSLNS